MTLRDLRVPSNSEVVRFLFMVNRKRGPPGWKLRRGGRLVVSIIRLDCGVDPLAVSQAMPTGSPRWRRGFAVSLIESFRRYGSRSDSGLYVLRFGVVPVSGGFLHRLDSEVHSGQRAGTTASSLASQPASAPPCLFGFPSH
jgi:hypothetical protein